MAQQNINNTNIPKWYQTEGLKNIKLTAGTYIGYVKNANDPERNGRLQVWLPDLGGDENDSKHWVIVRYASPFIGQTNTRGDLYAEKNKTNQFAATSSTYGMWMVPPDKGNQVLITFANGDPNRGYWFACVLDRKGHNMVPGIAGGTLGTDYDRNNVDNGAVNLKGAINSFGFDDKAPMGEFNEFEASAEPFLNRKKTLHTFQAPHWIEQGLTSDGIRGPTTSSSQRDMPSSVYGISTPGRPANDPGTANANDAANFVAQNKNKDTEVYQRVGGHQFVMDDGDYSGNNNQIRLRTAGGHQILMDDTSGTLYMINASGSGWIELQASGHCHVYASGSFNVRARGDINLHSDQNLRLYGKSSLMLRTEGKMIVEAADECGITSKKLTLFGDAEMNVLSQKGAVTIESANNQPIVINSGGDITLAPGANSRMTVNPDTHPTSLKPPPGLKLFKHNDTTWFGSTAGWKAQKYSTQSIVAVLPTHEPWDRNGYNLNTNDSLDLTKEAIPHWTTGADDINKHGDVVNVKVNADGTVRVTARDGTVSDVTLERLKGLKFAESYNIPSNKIPTANSYNASTLPPSTRGLGTHLTDSDVLSLLVGLGVPESGGASRGTYDQYRVNPNTNALGILQFTSDTLETLKYLKPGAFAQYGYNAVYREDQWLFPGGMKGFLDNRSEQWNAGQKLLEFNYNVMVRNGTITSNTEGEVVSGLLAASWIAGAGGATRMAFKNDASQPVDANKQGPLQYYKIGATAYRNKYSDLFGR